MHFLQACKLAAIVAAAGLTLAHPGAHEPSSYTSLTKRNFLHHARNSLDKCADNLESRGVNARAKARRAALVEKYRKRSVTIETRDTDNTWNSSHHSDLNVTVNTPASELFDANPVCILAPEGEVGPFWVKGEFVRYDITDNEEGIPVYMDGQFIDINTCEPIQDLYWDLWSCNTTGVYSGIDSDMNGNGNDAANLNRTSLRGIQKTDEDGVAGFKTIFPGHYAGRTTHYHIIAHLNATVLPNNTLTGGYVPHVGQVFFDQDLIYEVEATAPYNTNEVAITTNADDHVVSDETENSDSDPFLEYAFLGDSLADGLVAWVTLGVNVSANHDSSVSYAATLTENGGVANENSGGGGGPGGSGGPPSGAPPS
ncbi:Intradiol ring-cleavage dioxygenase [Aspergillus unguis]